MQPISERSGARRGAWHGIAFLQTKCRGLSGYFDRGEWDADLHRSPQYFYEPKKVLPCLSSLKPPTTRPRHRPVTGLS